MEIGLYYQAGAAAIAVLAAGWDLATWRIPNELTYGAAALALGLRVVGGGWRGLLDGLAAGLILGGVFLVFFVIRAMGAGDVKLMAAVGCWTGLRQGVVALLATALAGGILALGYSIIRRRGLQTLRNLAALIRYHLLVGVQPHPEINLDNPETVRLPYAVAIAVGTLYSSGTYFTRG